MIRSTVAKLVALGPLGFSCVLACASDAEGFDTVPFPSRLLQVALDTELAASKRELTADPFPAATDSASSLSQLLMDDARYALRSPAQWEQRTWQNLGWIGLAVAGTAVALDKPIQNTVQRNGSRTLTNVTRVFEPFGAQYSLAILGGFYLAGTLSDDAKATAVAQDGLASSLLASGIITPALKLAFGRSRPAQNEGTSRFRPFGGNASFPSGHTTQAFAVASVIASHYEPLWIKTTAYGVASLVGYARVYNNAHFASDVLAGAAIGTLVGTSLVAVNEKLRGSNVSLMPIAVSKGAGFALQKAF